jgi:hypothetical protein
MERITMLVSNTPQPTWLPLWKARLRFGIPRESDYRGRDLADPEICRRQLHRAVMAAAVVIYARPGTLTAEFVHIPPDAWGMLRVTDWTKGVAVAPDGTRYWSIHAVAAAHKANATPVPAREKGGAPPKYDYDMIRGEAFRLFRAHGLPDREGDDGWQTRADLERCLAEFCKTIHGEEPVKSTLQELAKRAIADWKKAEADKADNRLSAITGRCRQTRSSGRST